jgi:A/G-specific adenine glycosylase
VEFHRTIIDWQRQFGRHDLPWQASSDPYRIWVSEIMLQQTQVSTVLGYYARFLERFPNVTALANAPQDEVLALWAGLGYYSRARNLHRAAMLVAEQYGGQFPRDQEQLMQLPGIGRSTAAAILAFSCGMPTPILDGNVKRVFCRFFGVYGDPGSKACVDQLWQIAQQQMPQLEVQSYTQGLMDLGATVCVRSKPRCQECPLANHCHAQHKGMQSVLPERKKEKRTPTRAQVFLLIRRADQIVLQRQSSPGIWGGLFSLPRLLSLDLPEVELVQAYKNKKIRALLYDSSWFALARSWIANNADELSIPNKPKEWKIRQSMQFTHAFTHYKLLGLCLEVTLPDAAVKNMLVAHESNVLALQWFNATSVTSVGLPAPIAQLKLFDLANID